MYKRFSSNLDDVDSAVTIAQVLNNVGYHIPDVYDDLVCFAVKTAFMNSNNHDSMVTCILAACAKVGYQPVLSGDLRHLACNVYAKLLAQRRYKQALSILFDLMILQLYPENELSSLFTLERIEDLEQYMTDNPDTMKFLERIMMMLNRSVILECPQLDVPWFHEQYCIAAAKDADENVTVGDIHSKLRNDIHDVICEVLGGSQFVLRKTFSPYYYVIDFECLLDEQRRPVDVKHWHCAHQKQACQKVAVSVIPDSSYCYNSKELLIGQRLIQKRHLEIMDYKFVEIPYFEWFSMGLTDQQSKYEYIESKLL